VSCDEALESVIPVSDHPTQGKRSGNERLGLLRPEPPYLAGGLDRGLLDAGHGALLRVFDLPYAVALRGSGGGRSRSRTRSTMRGLFTQEK
jgi:hypothetical protein